MIDYISTIIETFPFLILSAGFLSQKINKLRLLLALIPTCIIKLLFVFLPVSQQMEFLSSFINTFIGITAIMIMTHSDAITSMFCYITSYLFLIVFQLSFVIVFYLTGLSINSDIFVIIGATYSLIITVLAYIFFDLHRMYNFLFETGKIGAIILSNIFAISFIIALSFKLDRTRFFDIAVFVFTTIFILLSINFILFNQLKRMREQTAQLKAYEQYLPVLESFIHNVRIKQHHHTNEIQSIMGLMHTCKDYDSLTMKMNEYLDISQKYDEPNYLLKLNMPLVAGFLYHKKLTASQKGIFLDYNISSYNLESSVPEYELVEYIGILIDNAVDASSKNDHVSINLGCRDKKVVFSTRNAGHILSKEERENFFKKGYSRKKNNGHSGLGLYQLKKMIVDNYSSSLSIWNEGTDILFEFII